MLKKTMSPGALADRANRRGFTLVEVVVALVILSVAILGLAASASNLATTAVTAELRAMALYSVSDRLAMIELDERYAELDSLYAATENDVLSVPGYTRTTEVARVNQSSPEADFTVVTVTVGGPLLMEPVTGRLVVGAP